MAPPTIAVFTKNRLNPAYDAAREAWTCAGARRMIAQTCDHAEQRIRFPLEIECGLTDRWQVDASWAGYAEFHENPFGNLRTARASIGTKYSFMNIAKSRA